MFSTRTASQTLNVNQGHIAIASAKSGFNRLASFGAGPCIIISVYNPKSKTALLAHFEASTKLDSLKFYIEKLKPTQRGVLQAHMVGSNQFTTKQFYEIANLLNSLGIKILTANRNVSGSLLASKKLLIDCKTGEVSEDFNISTLHETASKPMYGLQYKNLRCVYEEPNSSHPRRNPKL